MLRPSQRMRASFQFPPLPSVRSAYRAISYYTTNGFLHLSPSQSPIVAPMRAATEIKTPPTINTNLPAMVAMPTTARSNRIMVVGSTPLLFFIKQEKTTRDVMVRRRPTSDARTSSVRRSPRFLLHFFSFSLKVIKYTSPEPSIFFFLLLAKASNRTARDGRMRIY